MGLSRTFQQGGDVGGGLDQAFTQGFKAGVLEPIISTPIPNNADPYGSAAGLTSLMRPNVIKVQTLIIVAYQWDNLQLLQLYKWLKTLPILLFLVIITLTHKVLCLVVWQEWHKRSNSRGKCQWQGKRLIKYNLIQWVHRTNA